MMRLLRTFQAVNTAPDSENRMHDDSVARSLGFSGGGLVPGVDIFGYLVEALLLVNPQWMAPGQGGELRLRKPYFDGERVSVFIDDGTGEIHADDRAVLVPVAPMFPRTPPPGFAALPAERPAASEQSLAPGTTLGSIHGSPASARDLLELANEILMRNVILQPWIHTGSRIVWGLGIANKFPKNVELRGRVVAEFEKKGHRLVTLDLAYADDVARIEHTAIWQYRRG